MPLMNKIPNVFQYLVCNKIKEGLGFSECKYFFSGAAPIMLDTKEFFAGIDIPICEVIFIPFSGYFSTLLSFIINVLRFFFIYRPTV